MARTLRRTVVVGGVTYPAGTEETAKLSKAIPNPKAWDGEPDAAPKRRSSRTQTPEERSSKTQTQEEPEGPEEPEEPETSEGSDEPEQTGESGSSEESGESESEEPPRSGRGSGVEAWRRYASSLGIEVPEDASRDDIVALVDAR